MRHPLRCASWTAVAADLADPSWAGALLAAGFDPSKPTVWVAEGECSAWGGVLAIRLCQLVWPSGRQL